VFAPDSRAAAGSAADLAAARDSCGLYPIALSAQSLLDRSVGDTLTDILNGEQPGDFGWLTWAGSPSVPTLVTSLTPPGDSQTYVNPEDPSDTVISVGDWIQGSPGVSNSKNVRAALEALKTIDIAVPVWDAVRGQGNNADYRVAAFARIRILDYQLPGQNRISAHFLGYTCEGAVIRLAKSVDTTVLTPTLDLAFNVDQDDAIPGDVLTYTAIATNAGATLTLSGTFTVENLSDVAATVAYYDDLVDYQPITGDEWTPLAGAAAALPGYSPVSPAPLTSGLTLNATGQPAPGVVYPTSGDGIVGTQLDPGGVAVWEYQATLSLSPEQVSLLLDSASVRDVRNSIHFEVTPRLAERGQPFVERISFVDLLRPHAERGDLTNVVLTMTLPGGERILFDATTTPALAILSPGASASVEATYQVPALASKGANETDEAYLARLAAADRANLTAAAEAAATSSSGPVSALPRTAVTTQHVPVVTLLKTGPETVDPGETVIYELTLRNIGSATASELALEDLLPNNDLGLINDAPMSLDPGASALAHASHTVPNAQPPGDLTDIASALWEDANDNIYGPVTDTFTTEVLSLVPAGVLTLAPAFAGPNVTGTQQTLVATLKDTNNVPLPGVTVHFAVSGPNATTGEGMTGADGTVAFTYTGANNGFDSVQATAVIDGTVFESNTATIHWVTPTQTVTTSTIWGRFFTADNSGIFKTPPTQAPVFGQAFPSINFNPPAGTVPGNTSGVGVNTRPFTNVTMDLNGNYAGTIVAQGNGFQAGVGSLHNFSAVFTGEFTIAEAGNATFDFFSDDGFIFGIGNGAQRVGGANTNPPASGLTPFEAYSVMGAYNRPTAPVRNSITVYFPEPGTYPFEIDYTECCGGQLALTLAVRETGFGVTPVGSLVISPNSTQTRLTGEQQTFTVTAQDASGLPLSDLLVMLRVNGANTQELTTATDATGAAVFTYTGYNVGADTVQAVAWAQGDISAYSAEVRVNWQRGAPPPTDPGTPLAVPGWIGSPANQSTLTGQVPIRLGSGINLQTGTIDYWPVDDPGALAVLATNVSGGGGSTLATLDTTLLANGSYIIRLQGTNTSGTQVNSGIMVTVQGEYKPGRVRFTVTDFTVPITGLPITIGRTYDSLNRNQVGDFGYGWDLFLSSPDVEVNQANDVTITMPNGERVTFYFTPYAPSPWFGFLLLPDYTPEPGVYGDLTANSCGLLTVSGGSYFCFPGGLYSATGFTYTDPYGNVFVMNADGDLRSIQDLNGNLLTFTEDGILSSTGLNVSFERDSQGRITSITDPEDVEYSYTYNADGDLEQVILPDTSTPIQYTYYAGHFFKEASNARGYVAAQTTYDTNGRLLSISDELGQTTHFAYNLTSRTTTKTQPDGGVVVSTYAAQGNLLSEVDPLGRTTTNTYDANHNRLTSTDDLGNTTSYTYSANGHVTSVTNPMHETVSGTPNQYGVFTSIHDGAGRIKNFDLDSAMNLSSVSDATGTIASFSWNSQGNPLTITDGEGSTTTFSYDASGNVLTKTNASDETIRYTYDLMGRKLTETDARGYTTTYTYDALGHILTITNPLGGTTSYTYDNDGNMLTETDPEGRTIYSAYDALGRLIEITYPDSSTETYTYDWRDNIITETDRDGVATRFTYDEAGQLVSITYAAGTADEGAVIYIYDDGGRRIKEIDPLGNVTTYTFDSAGRQLTKTDPLNRTTTYIYDKASQLIASIDANNHRIDHAYNSRGQLVLETYSDGSTVQYSYDGRGQRTNITDQAGKITRNFYDDAGRLSMVVNPNNEATSYSYDENGNLLTITDANGHQTSFTYDALNRQTRKTWPDNSYEEMHYDQAGNLVEHQLNDGHINSYIYDDLNQLTAINYFDGTNVAITYTPGGQVRTVTDNRGTTTYSYDGANRLVQMLDPSTGSVEYGYDRAGNRLTLTTPIGTTGYTYDAAQQLIAVTDSAGGTTTLAYNPNGQRAVLALPNGITTTYTYDAVDRLTDIVQTNALGDILNSYRYTLDPIGNRTIVRYQDGSGINWRYDDADRLIRETTLDTAGGNVQDVAYAYDPVGNIIQKTTNGTAVSYTYNELDQLQAAGTTEYRYDARGNLIEIQDGTDVRSFTWDAADRLIAATYPDGMSAAYQYDWQGRRVMKQIGTDSTHYLWDITSQYGDVVAEFDGSGAPLVEYVLAGPSLIGEVRGDNASYLLTDGQGSIRTVTNNVGTITNEYSYEAYGSLLASAGTTPNSYRYTAQQFDTETGLYSLRARYYDPSAGRFLSRDTAPFETSNPAAINRYVYAASNPITYQDPTGHTTTTLQYPLTLQISASTVIKVVAAVGYAVGCLYVKSATAIAAVARDRATLLMIEILYPSPTICHWSIMIYPGPATPTVSQHMVDAGVLGPYGIVFERETNPLNVIRNRRAACSRARRLLFGVTGSCDEYPFASTTAGGANSSIRGVPLWENWAQGGYIGAFYLWKVIPSPYNEFVVVVIP
jgi:RHS repeat-associated protein/uncharacterized repeat protein (TIGR01451 family)